MIHEASKAARLMLNNAKMHEMVMYHLQDDANKKKIAAESWLGKLTSQPPRIDCECAMQYGKTPRAG